GDALPHVWLACVARRRPARASRAARHQLHRVAGRGDESVRARRCRATWQVSARNDEAAGIASAATHAPRIVAKEVPNAGSEVQGMRSELQVAERAAGPHRAATR